MNERPNPPGDDLADGWPDEPGNDELTDFAARLRGSRPALSPEALARVGAAMQREMAARPARRRRWALFAGCVAAAAVAVLAVGIWMHLRPAERPPTSPSLEVARPRPPHEPAKAAAAVDTYRVRLLVPPAEPPARPLLPLERYETLYVDVR